MSQSHNIEVIGITIEKIYDGGLTDDGIPAAARWGAVVEVMSSGPSRFAILWTDFGDRRTGLSRRGETT
jgi:hypothetical protein